ncbi:siderophore-interacting protein [Paracoccus onubensis]|uniref:Siderophore-interacting protein n=1 Tax=Paracoccus onubensis TaxID=1675788 RepID=A0A418SY75_9RHOB|nr:siderophore-interacting protein [Paracoccus onubensis]RJE85865.1 siderophore-interacting protein [Paracoccus onubensis]
MNIPRRPENFRIATVAETRSVTPLMRRVTVHVDDLSRFDCPLRALGPHVHALIPRSDMARQEWPTADERGHAVYPPPERRPAIRTYSVRRFRHAENLIDLDFVLHGDDGIASAWAARTEAGEEIGLWRPHARVLDSEPARYLLAGDLTALPAIAFILDHLPEDAAGEVLISVPGPAEQQTLRLPAAMKLTWLHEPTGNGDRLARAAETALGTGTGADSFVWAGAEAATARRIRNHARRVCGIPATRVYALNYWKRGMVEGSYDHGE